jgi:hypothetical protein
MPNNMASSAMISCTHQEKYWWIVSSVCDTVVMAAATCTEIRCTNPFKYFIQHVILWILKTMIPNSNKITYSTKKNKIKKGQNRKTNIRNNNIRKKY